MQDHIRKWLTIPAFTPVAERPRGGMPTRRSDRYSDVASGATLPFPETADITSPEEKLLVHRKDLAWNVVRRAGVEAVLELAERFQLTRIRLYRLP